VSTVEKIRIPDLREPVLSDIQRRALADAEQTPFELSVDAVLGAAAKRARLEDFGPDDFHERLALLLDEVAWDGHTKLSQLSTFRRMVNKATDRLLTIDLLSRHPEILEEPIEAPLIVAGLPRSGTTHLLNLIAADSRFQSTPYWQVLRPVPIYPEDYPEVDGIDPRWKRAQAGWEVAQQMSPYAVSFHPMDPDHISEDGEIQMQDFSSYVWEFTLRAPRWRDYYYSHDQTPHYEWEKRVLQILQWQRGYRRRWIVKAPQHLEQLPAILNVFPDAVVVFTHRDPVASLQSILTMRTWGTRTREKRLDPDYDLDYWTERYGHLLDTYLRDIDRVPKGQQFDSLFHEFVGDDVATVERIYQTAGMPMTDTARDELDTYMSTHGRGHAGQIVFDLRGDFDVDPGQIRERYADYLQRIPVELEVK
jgi:hypothetical protein